MTVPTERTGASGTPRPITLHSAYLPPTAAGCSHAEHESWKPALRSLIAEGTPAVFTSYNAEEAEVGPGLVRATGDLMGNLAL